MDIREQPYSLVIHTTHDNGVSRQRGYLFTDRYMDEVVEGRGSEPGKSLRAHLQDPTAGTYELTTVGLSSLSDVEWDCSAPLEGFTITHVYLTHEYEPMDAAQ